MRHYPSSQTVSQCGQAAGGRENNVNKALRSRRAEVARISGSFTGCWRCCRPRVRHRPSAAGALRRDGRRGRRQQLQRTTTTTTTKKKCNQTCQRCCLGPTGLTRDWARKMIPWGNERGFVTPEEQSFQFPEGHQGSAAPAFYLLV